MGGGGRGLRLVFLGFWFDERYFCGFVQLNPAGCILNFSSRAIILLERQTHFVATLPLVLNQSTKLIFTATHAEPCLPLYAVHVNIRSLAVFILAELLYFTYKNIILYYIIITNLLSIILQIISIFIIKSFTIYL